MASSDTLSASAFLPAQRGHDNTRARWVQLWLGVVAMMAISSPQYVWTLFLKPMQASLGQSMAAVQVTFSILIVLQTWLGPVQGWLVERYGPRLLVGAGSALTGASWVLAGMTDSLWGLYLTYGVLGGMGTGIVYMGVIGLMVKWFPDRRGFATGMAAAGYGIGAIVFTFPVSSALAAYGHQDTLFAFGLAFGIIGLLVSQFLYLPPPGWHAVAAHPTPLATVRSFGPSSMLRNPIFWLLFVMMTMMSTGGLMVVSQMGAFAREFGVAGLTVWGMAALPLAMTVDRVTNGVTRPFFGWVSDRIGRENTMVIAFTLEGIAIMLLLTFRHDPVAFVLLSGLVFFGWGEIFSLFPSILTDTFGPDYAARNYGCLYMAQGVGSVLGGPVAALLHDQWGSWLPVFQIVIGLDIATAVAAALLLKPMRRRWLARVDPAAA